MPADMIWLYWAEKKRFVQIERQSARLDWKWLHAPEGMVKYQPREKSPAWSYCYWGTTPEDCCAAANRNAHIKIGVLEDEIAQLRANLVVYSR